MKLRLCSAQEATAALFNPGLSDFSDALEVALVERSWTPLVGEAQAHPNPNLKGCRGGGG